MHAPGFRYGRRAPTLSPSPARLPRADLLNRRGSHPVVECGSREDGRSLGLRNAPTVVSRHSRAVIETTTRTATHPWSRSVERDRRSLFGATPVRALDYSTTATPHHPVVECGSREDGRSLRSRNAPTVVSGHSRAVIETTGRRPCTPRGFDTVGAHQRYIHRRRAFLAPTYSTTGRRPSTPRGFGTVGAHQPCLHRRRAFLAPTYSTAGGAIRWLSAARARTDEASVYGTRQRS